MTVFLLVITLVVFLFLAWVSWRIVKAVGSQIFKPGNSAFANIAWAVGLLITLWLLFNIWFFLIATSMVVGLFGAAVALIVSMAH